MLLLDPEMKPVFTFFLLVAFLLTGGNELAHAGASFHNNEVSGTAGIKKILETATEKPQQNFLRAGNNTSGQQKDVLDLVADEEDEQDDISRKNFSQTISFTAFFYAFISNYSGNNTIDRNCFYKLPLSTGSCKYIEQRSLRI